VAGIGKEEFRPLLALGFHSLDADGRHGLCVERFPSSVTRPKIMANLERIIAQINDHGITADIWIDGSFLTEKLNPDDVDIALVISRTAFEALSARQRIFFEYFRDTSFYNDLKIDNYGVVIDDTEDGQWMYSYWLRQFGFSRRDLPKGILKVSVPFLVMR
jgi:hypothetical protein